ncbi:MAG: tetratricopeptide repeat protein [Acidobacteriota bacterium]
MKRIPAMVLLLLIRPEAGSLMAGERGLYLEVTVKDEAGAPIPGAEMAAEGFAAWAGQPVYTQAEGWAVLTNLEKGHYRLRASAPRYISVVYDDHLIASDHVQLVLRGVPEAAPQSTVPAVGRVDLAAAPNAQSDYRKGIAQLQERHYEKVRKFFVAAVRAYPSHSAACAGLGTSFLQEGRRAEALEAFQESVRLNKSCYEALLGSALVLNDLKRYPKAHQRLAAAAGLQVNHPWSLYYELGRTHYGLDQLYDAERNFRKAREAHPR